MDSRTERRIEEDFNRGVDALAEEQWEEAERLFTGVLAALPRTQNSNLGWALVYLGRSEYEQERFESAERHYREGIDVFRRVQDIESLADAKRRLGVLLSSTSSRIEAALREFSEARRLAYKARHHVGVARIDESAGFALLDRGRPAEAYDYIVRAHAGYARAEKWELAAHLSLRAGQRYEDLRQHEWARAFILQAHQEWADHDLPHEAQEALVDGYSLFEGSHQHPESLAAKQRALDDVPDPAAEVRLRLSIADELIHVGRIGDAGRQVVASARLLRRLEDNSALAGKVIVEWSRVTRLGPSPWRRRLAAVWLRRWGRAWLKENADSDWRLWVDVAKFLGMLSREVGRHREAVELLSSARDAIPSVREVVAYAFIVAQVAEAKLGLAKSRDGRKERAHLIGQARDESVIAAIIIDSFRHNLDSSDWRSGWILGVRTEVAATAFRAASEAGDAVTLAGLVESLRGGGGLSMTEHHGTERGLTERTAPPITTQTPRPRETALTAGVMGILGSREFLRTVPGPNVELPHGGLALFDSMRSAAAVFRTPPGSIRQPIRVPVA